MMFTDLQLKFILQKKTELIKKTEPSINEVIVEFLKKYDVNIESATIQEINLGTGLKGALFSKYSVHQFNSNITLVFDLCL